MSGGKETPRQKMIGMMYLVLTALLALNVSKDILNAFIVVDTGLTKTNTNFDNKNEMTYNAFAMSMLTDEAKTKPFFDKANVVKARSHELNEYINELKSELYVHVQGVTKAVADTMDLNTLESKDNYDIPTHFLIGENPEKATGKAKELKDKIVKFREDILNLIPEKDRRHLKLGLNTDDVYSKMEEKNISWENNAFYHSPMAAVITILSKIQNDVKNAEGDVINLLYRSVSAADFKFDVLEAKVIPNSNYVLMGEEYKADVFVAAFSTTKNPQIWLGNVDTSTNSIVGAIDSNSISVTRGVGKYSVRASSEGTKKYAGIINVKSPDNSIKSYPFSGEYMVAKPALVVSATKMNVLYIGVDNPIDISVPGVAAENLQPSLAGGTLTGAKGSYVARVTGGTEAMVSVSAKGSSGPAKPMGSFKFRVKRVPDPVAFVAGKKGDATISKSEALTIPGVVPKLENFDFDLKYEMVSFEMTMNIRGTLVTVPATGNALTEEMKKNLKFASAGTKIYFENVRAKGPNGVVSIAGVNLKVK